MGELVSYKSNSFTMVIPFPFISCNAFAVIYGLYPFHTGNDAMTTARGAHKELPLGFLNFVKQGE